MGVRAETRIRDLQLPVPALIGAVVERDHEKHRAISPSHYDLASGRRLRWKGAWLMYSAGSGASQVDLYDMRARWWCPQLGVFVKVDDFGYASQSNTLWGWANGNPLRFSDLSGHDGTTDNPVQWLLDHGWMPSGLAAFGRGIRQRANGIAELANDSTFEQGMRDLHCGSAAIANSGGKIGSDVKGIFGGALQAALPGIFPLARALEGAEGVFGSLLEGGHLVDLHVGLDAAALDARLAAQGSLSIASSFSTIAEAEAAASAAFAQNAETVAAWVDSGATGRLAIDGDFSGGTIRVIGGLMDPLGSDRKSRKGFPPVESMATPLVERA